MNYQSIDHQQITIANNDTISMIGVGDIMLPTLADALDSCIWLTSVLYSPQLGYTLISVAKIDDMGYSITFVGG